MRKQRRCQCRRSHFKKLSRRFAAPLGRARPEWGEGAPADRRGVRAAPSRRRVRGLRPPGRGARQEAAGCVRANRRLGCSRRSSGCGRTRWTKGCRGPPRVAGAPRRVAGQRSLVHPTHDEGLMARAPGKAYAGGREVRDEAWTSSSSECRSRCPRPDQRPGPSGRTSRTTSTVASPSRITRASDRGPSWSAIAWRSSELQSRART